MRTGLAVLLWRCNLLLRRCNPGPDGSEDLVALQDGLGWGHVLPPRGGLGTSLSPLRTPCLPRPWNLAAFPLVSASVPPATPTGLHSGFVCF